MPTDSHGWCSDPEAYYRFADASRIPILHQTIADRIARTDVTQILDFGSGDGRIFRSFMAIDPYRIVLHDIDETALAAARRAYADRSNVRIVADPDDIELGRFGAVICCNVLMLMRTRSDLNATVRVLSRSLAPDGTVYVGITHPCFLDREFSTYTNDFTTGTQKFDYFADGTAYEVQMQTDRGQIVIEDFFWSLSSLVNAFLAEGMTLSAMQELEDVTPGNYPPFLLLQFVQ